MSKTSPTYQAKATGGSHDLGPEQMSKYFLELEGLLDRVARSSTHFQVLGVERTATLEDIRRAYGESIDLLYPPYAVSVTLPAETLAKMEEAFNRSTHAFGVLASYGKRVDYDASLGGRAGKAVSLDAPGPAQAKPAAKARAGSDRAAPDKPDHSDESLLIKSAPAHKEVYAEFFNKAKADNRRRCERYKLALPVRLTGYDRNHSKWHEMAQTIDVSRTGINLRMRKSVRHGMVLYLTLPMPVKLRTHGYSDSSYNVYALVRRVEPPRKGSRVVGLEFIGEHPPAGYLEKPWVTFRTKQWNGIERRRKPREARAETVMLEYFTESMQSVGKDFARTENISASGARVCVKEAPAEFDLVRMQCANRAFEAIAAVTNRFLGRDGLERLCLQFIDKQWPAI